MTNLNFIESLADEGNKKVLNAIVEIQTHAIMAKHFNVITRYLADLHIGLAISSTETTGPKSLQRGGASLLLGELVSEITGAITLFNKQKELERTTKVFPKDINS